MKVGTLEFYYFEMGDYVTSPEGIGVVIEDEKPIKYESDLFYSQISVELKHTPGKIIKMDRMMLTRISQKDYETENF